MNTTRMNPTYDFAGQVALVTGASSGMGLDTARAFAVQAASVALADIKEDALCAAQRQQRLTGVGGRTRMLPPGRREAVMIGG